MTKEKLLETLKNGLIVSCQALPHEPMYVEEGGIMPLFAKAAYEAGAVGIRANSVRDILQIKAMINLPIIGLIKQTYPNSEAYITPTMAEVDALVATGCEAIAVEFTSHTREDKLSPSTFIAQIKERYPNTLIMADCATLEDACAAEAAGVDFLGTTMCGYTSDSPMTDGPNFDLVRQISHACKAPVFAEGRIHYPDQARLMLDLGAHCVIVGGAITRPREITDRFIRAIKA